jgi:hypothetical protein
MYVELREEVFAEKSCAKEKPLKDGDGDDVGDEGEDGDDSRQLCRQRRCR